MKGCDVSLGYGQKLVYFGSGVGFAASEPHQALWKPGYHPSPTPGFVFHIELRSTSATSSVELRSSNCIIFILTQMRILFEPIHI